MFLKRGRAQNYHIDGDWKYNPWGFNQLLKDGNDLRSFTHGDIEIFPQ
jgi:hypothetical protein